MSTGDLGERGAVEGYLGAKMAVIGQELGVNERWFLTADTLNVKLPKTAGLAAGNYVSIIRALDGNFTPQIQSQDAAFIYSDGGVYGGEHNVVFELASPAIVLYWNGEAWQDEEYSSADSANAIRQGEKIFTKSGHFDIPAVNSVTVTVVGGGGGGGSGANYYTSGSKAAGGGGGGGGGAVVDAVIDVTPGKRVTVLVGGGGRRGVSSAHGTSIGGDGNDGGNSSFGDYVTANGGKRGLGGRYGTSSSHGGTGGAGGTVNAPDGVSVLVGGDGGDGGNGNSKGGAPTGESGGNVGGFQGGKSVKTHPSEDYVCGGGGGGGASAKGAGASCRYRISNTIEFGGEDGSLYGGGGSGRAGWVWSHDWAGNSHAGSGASGIVIVKWGNS